MQKNQLGKTFNDVIQENEKNLNTLVSEAQFRICSIHENKKRKGGILGELRECISIIKLIQNQLQILTKLVLKLKVTPYKKLKNGQISAKEKIGYTIMIDYHT